ncbi:MAG: hypothetical protein SFU99_06995 [Saprospiraceae bacterium]|nr:hypothetical protein [Saprospiraceae bacterium]
MRKRLLILYFEFLFFSLALASNSPGRVDSFYENEISQTVFNRLIDARGDFGLPRPQLKFVKDTTELARISGQTIFLGAKAYQVCRSFGADSLNALAALLSHELIHYYSGHSWEHEFSRAFANMDLSKEIKDGWFADEVQADLWGGLLAFSAGYNVQKILPEFFPKLYNIYGLSESISGYPKLQERIQLAQKSAEKLDILLGFFETANCLVALGMHEDAIAYYQMILREGYRAREVYNNIGVYYTLAALQLFKKGQIPYGLPLELDAKARVGESLKANDDKASKEKRVQLLQEAISYFEQARALDPEYAVALINQGCAYTLLGIAAGQEEVDLVEEQYTQALLLAKRAEREAREQKRTKVQSDGLVLRGILAAVQSDSTDALKLWAQAATMGNALAKVNTEILQNGASETASNRLEKSNEREQIEKVSLDLFLRQPTFDTIIKLESPGMLGKWSQSSTKLFLEQSKIFAHFISQKRYAVLHFTKDDYSNQTLLGIKIGDAREKLMQTYRLPDKTIQTAQGELLVYPAREIMFWLNENGQVERWCVFRFVNAN